MATVQLRDEPLQPIGTRARSHFNVFVLMNAAGIPGKLGCCRRECRPNVAIRLFEKIEGVAWSQSTLYDFASPQFITRLMDSNVRV